MKFTSILVSLALAAATIAGPLRGPMPVEERDVEERTVGVSVFHPTPIYGCLQDFQAAAIVKAFHFLLANPKSPNFTPTANALLANAFTDTSDSINQLAGIPEGSVTFASKAAFIAGSSSQPPLILQGLDTQHSCNTITWRWISVKGAGNDQTPVKGIDQFYINQLGQIDRIYAEFNSGAWLANLGYPECPS